METFTVESAARIALEANRAYCITIGDHSMMPWEEAPEWQRATNVQGVQFHLAFLKQGVDPEPSASHDSWLDAKRIDGWAYGIVKNPEKKEHPCFVPYEELPPEQRAKDYLFGAIVKSLFVSGILQ